MDIMGPLTRTKTIHTYCSGPSDQVAVPLKRVDAETTCTVNIFACYGVPEEIVHDNGGNFTAQLMKEVLGVMGIQQIRTSLTTLRPMVLLKECMELSRKP